MARDYSNTTTTADPRNKGAKDVSQQKPIAPPGTEQEMTPKPDHGEHSYKGYGRLKDRVAVITGADSGIGRAVAIAFAREGADIVISYLNENEDAKETEKWVKDAGRRAVRIAGDIQNEQHCLQIIERTYGEFGRLDVLVNNAAFQMEHEGIQEFTTEEFERTFRTNVFATFWLSKAALPKMRAGGVIINTSSIQAYDPSPGLLAYAPTKAAIVGLTKALSKAAIKQGVRVNAVAPGPVWTPLVPSTLKPDHVKKFGQNSLFERPAQPAEIAPLYAFLASDDSSYVTGEVFAATGGRTPF
ncbi:MAG: yghA [Bryobacterales bacterium]|nr:yghA [Bryobacterales bacterium]